MSDSKIKVISFDLDNTLYDNTPVILLAEQKSQAYLQAEFEKQHLKFSYQSFIDYRNELVYSENNLSPDQPSQYQNLSYLRQQVLQKCCSSLQDCNRIAEQSFEIFLKYRNSITIDKKIESMLEQLNQKFLLVSVSNGNCDASNLSINHLFKQHYSPVQGFRAKPHPQMLAQVLLDFEIRCDQLLHVGDQIDSDAAAAKQIDCEFHYFAPFIETSNLTKCCEQLMGNFIY